LWVEKSRDYLGNVLGEDWQEDYYIWDCCAGTCNLLAGLSNKYNVWASTLDQPDVDIVHEIIDRGSLNLLKSHVFRFDFLNDDFSKLPQELQDIINDEEKRKKLIVYMNPPYAEAGTSVSRKSKTGVSNETMVHEKYFVMGEKFAKRELFVQFLIRIYKEIPDCVIAHFSKLKILNAPYFRHFRDTFQAKLEKLFIVPADTFDNVKGRFPIGFMIWNTAVHRKLTVVKADVFDRNGIRR
jgi:16S rRNA G966 N2-methylase RsmD